MKPIKILIILFAFSSCQKGDISPSGLSPVISPVQPVPVINGNWYAESFFLNTQDFTWQARFQTWEFDSILTIRTSFYNDYGSGVITSIGVGFHDYEIHGDSLRAYNWLGDQIWDRPFRLSGDLDTMYIDFEGMEWGIVR